MCRRAEGNGTPFQYSCLENPMEGGALKAAVHRVAEGWTRLSDFTFTFHFHPLEKKRATHSSVLAWRIPGTGEPGGLPSMRSHRVGHDWSDLAAAEEQRCGRPPTAIVLMLSCFSPVWFSATIWTHSPPGSSIHGILQARILEWIAMPSSRGSSWPRDQTQVS